MIKKRIVSLVLSMCMMLIVMPMAFATGWNGTWNGLSEDNIGINHKDTHFKIDCGNLDDKYIYGVIGDTSISKEPQPVAELPNSGWNWAVTKDADGVRLILNNANINTNGNFDTLMFNCDLVLELRGTNTLTNNSDKSSVLSGNDNRSLTIMGDGTLNLTGGSRSISLVNNANLTVNSGTINAESIWIDYKQGQIDINSGRVTTEKFRCPRDSYSDNGVNHDKSVICFGNYCKYGMTSDNEVGTELKLNISSNMAKVHTNNKIIICNINDVDKSPSEDKEEVIDYEGIFWNETRSKIMGMEKGSVVEIKAKYFDKMSWRVMQAIYDNEMGAKISRSSGDDIYIPVGKAQNALADLARVYYPMSYLEKLYVNEKA